MTQWKLTRLAFGNEEYTFRVGEKVTVGRAIDNTITLSSIVVSRNHCVIIAENNTVLITDLKSSNGVYVGLIKIPHNTPYVLNNSDVIGIGWTEGAPLAKINDEEKYVFKLTKEISATPLINKIQFQPVNELSKIDVKTAALRAVADSKINVLSEKVQSPVSDTRLALKRKVDLELDIDTIKKEIKEEKKCPIITIDEDIITLISDSENEINPYPEKLESKIKKLKLEPVCKDAEKPTFKDQNEDFEYEAFNVKQELLGYDEEPIKVDSDSDSESENWLIRLSQSSPGKPFMKVIQDKIEDKHEDTSYSQLDDFVDSKSLLGNINSEEEFIDDLITIPPHQPDIEIHKHQDDEFANDLISIETPSIPLEPLPPAQNISKDVMDGLCSDKINEDIEKQIPLTIIDTENTTNKKAQMIEPLIQIPRGKSYHNVVESKTKSGSSKYSKVKKHSSTKKHISNSQKEEHKKKLKALAIKDKDQQNSSKNDFNNPNKPTANIKVTASNRGAFLSDVVQVAVKPIKRKDVPLQSDKSKDISSESLPKHKQQSRAHESAENNENKQKQSEKSTNEHSKESKHKDKYDSTKSKTKHSRLNNSSVQESRVPLKSLKPLTESDESYSGKPFSKVEPMPPEKPKKKVRFSDSGPQIHFFEIQPGNKMKKTSLVKTSLVDIRQKPVFSLEKITLMKILRWNPHWLEEQINNNEPPPILGHNSPPMTIFHSFVNHSQYVQLVGDLLLMEIWECLTIGYMKIRNQHFGLQMRIASLPIVPSQERCFELFNLSVNISLPTNEARNAPRVGEIIVVTFGPENAKCQRFFFVHNVRCLPAPQNNKHSFFCISLHATFTEKMRMLRPGELIIGQTLAYINKELILFEAMEYLAGSPLSEAILKPEPRHFARADPNPACNIKSQWTMTLNQSQHDAVTSSVSAALGDQPCIQMVQGPPGTGKSSVICAIVMTYFYDEQGRKQKNRGKILICATSNAAVDELVIRLLNIRQSLPKSERFRMVRVGRLEAMHARARDVSSQQLAQRDAARAAEPDRAPAPPGLREEISHLEAKINMWRTTAEDAKDPVRVAYCQNRVAELVKRIALVQGGGGDGGAECAGAGLGRRGGGCGGEQLAAAERRIVEGADIVLTTLASAHNHKMRGLKRRIALCIIDEAGQVIEPETLIPLTLDVTRLTLIGDPQQLPGYICSQRAKKHGLGESLFSRLTSCSDHWEGSRSVVVLNQQYRMHPDIADYPNRAFYGGRIRTAVSPPPSPRLHLDIPPYAVISISSGDKGQGASGANEMEAWGVARVAAALAAALRAHSHSHSHSHSLSLAVITPYNAHKDLIKKNLRMLQDPSEAGVEVNTVDSFQGQERDVVVVSLARSHGVGFLTDAGRMNVMLTRARHALLLCLNPHALLRHNQWRTLVEDAQRRHMYRALPNKMCQPLSASQVHKDEILSYITNKI